jgi:hypothetical protein
MLEIDAFDPTFTESSKGKPYSYAMSADSVEVIGDNTTEGPFTVKSSPTIMKELGHKSLSIHSR